MIEKKNKQRRPKKKQKRLPRNLPLKRPKKRSQDPSWRISKRKWQILNLLLSRKRRKSVRKRNLRELGKRWRSWQRRKKKRRKIG